MTYVMQEDHVATFVPDGAHDYDRGLHVLVGEDKFRGQIYCMHSSPTLSLLCFGSPSDLTIL